MSRLPLLKIDGTAWTRGDCLPGGENAMRPCRLETCVHRLEDGRCSLDIADEGEKTLEAVGEIIGVTRERVRQIAMEAFRKLGRSDLDPSRSFWREKMEGEDV
jgi:hypothetical protein